MDNTPPVGQGGPRTVPSDPTVVEDSRLLSGLVSQGQAFGFVMGFLVGLATGLLLRPR